MNKPLIVLPIQDVTDVDARDSQTPAPTKRPKTSAEYQAAYRARLKQGEGRTVNVVLKPEVYEALRELAEAKKSTQRAVIEGLILQEAARQANTPENFGKRMVEALKASGL